MGRPGQVLVLVTQQPKQARGVGRRTFLRSAVPN